jgi:hypothetical protein
VNRITRLVFVAVPGLDCLSGSVACPSSVLAVGVAAARAGQVRFLRVPPFLAGRGSVLVIGGFVRSLRLACRSSGLLFLPVFPGHRPLSLSRGGGSRPDGSRPAA